MNEDLMEALLDHVDSLEAQIQKWKDDIYDAEIKIHSLKGEINQVEAER